MYRTSIGIKDDDFKKIKEIADKKSLDISEYIRTLIRIGLKVEIAAETSPVVQPGQTNHHSETETQLKTLLTWGLESRYLIRYLIKTNLQETIEQRKLFLKEAKEKAALRIEELLDD